MSSLSWRCSLGPVGHAAISVSIGGAVSVSTGTPLALPAALVTGVLIDADHVPDYYLWYWRRDRRWFFVPGHAWEIGVAALALAIAVGSGPIVMAAVLGYFGHLFADQFGNRLAHPLVYSILYRSYARFDRIHLAGEVPDTFGEAFERVPLWGVVGPRVIALARRLGLEPAWGRRSPDPDLPHEGEG